MNAPVSIFLYNNPGRAVRTIEHLLENELAAATDVIIFSCNSNSPEEEFSNLQIREYSTSVIGFKSVTVGSYFNSDDSKSFKITQLNIILEKYGKVIVLEEGQFPKPDFLSFMNHQLDLYENRMDVFSISGKSLDITIPVDYHLQQYLSFRTSTEGFATWKSRWNKTNWEKTFLSQVKSDPAFLKELSEAGMVHSDFQEKGFKNQIEEFNFFWQLNHISNKAFTIIPVVSKVMLDDFTMEELESERYIRENELLTLPDGRITAAIKENYTMTFLKKLKTLFKKILDL